MDGYSIFYTPLTTIVLTLTFASLVADNFRILFSNERMAYHNSILLIDALDHHLKKWYVYYCTKKLEKYLYLTRRPFLLHKGTYYYKAGRFLRRQV